MGQKIHPTGFRLSIQRNWSSKWYANSNNFATMLNEDIKVRAFLNERLKGASVGRILIERPSKNARITIFSSRPGVVIGKRAKILKYCAMNCKKEWGFLFMSILRKYVNQN